MTISKESKRRVRLQKAVDAELGGGEFKFKISPCVASRAVGMSEHNAKGNKVAAMVDLFVGSCITEEGDPYFKNAAEAQEMLDIVPIEESTALMDRILELTSSRKKLDAAKAAAVAELTEEEKAANAAAAEAARGNSEGSPSA